MPSTDCLISHILAIYITSFPAVLCRTGCITDICKVFGEPVLFCPGLIYFRQPSGRQYVRNLSGGNQQKVVLAKWLYSGSNLLIFDEPTRGIDVGARQEIYRVMDKLTAEGTSILMVSSDLPEIMTIADRIFVMRDGRITAELDATKTDQEEIIAYATGGKEAK
jgi:ABC-type multidrug transport system ATPase subunit